MAVFSKIMRTIARCEKIFCGVCLLASCVVIMLSVVGRRIGHAPQWSEEAVRYLMIWITFIGSGVCFRRSSHFGVDVIRRVPNKAFQKFISIFVILACAAFGVFLLWIGARYTMFTKMSGQRSAALLLPIWMLYVSVPIGGGLILVHLIEVVLSEVFGIYTIEE